MRCIGPAVLKTFACYLLALCASCAIIGCDSHGGPLRRRADVLKQTAILASTQKTLEIYASYAGAAYYINDTWTCIPECQNPDTSGTVVDYTWDIGVITSNGYIAHNPTEKVIVVSFRGTYEQGDWIQDFTLTHTPWPPELTGSSVVTGFYAGYIVAKPLVIQNALEVATRYPDYTIIAVGHSLGASRAAMFVADFALHYPELRHRLQLFTYGQAKCANRVFADFMNGLNIPIIRVVNKGDIAPHLPNDDSTLVQFGTEVWYTPTNNTVICSSGDYSRCSDSLPQSVLNADDHSTYPGL